MALNLLQEKGVPLAQQRFTWKELVQRPFSKLDDAFTRVRVILMICTTTAKRPASA
jgi:hypothetical protein